jgi:hypothetical protein
MYAALDAIVERSRTRLQNEWNHRATHLKSKVRSLLHQRKSAIAELRKSSNDGLFDEDDFLDELDGLPDVMVDPAPYIEAAKAGQRAVPGYEDRAIDPHALGQAHASYRRKYADGVPLRISGSLAQTLNEAAGETNGYEDVDKLWQIVDDKIAALASDVTRYADPPWSAGNAGYGNQLGEFDVLMDWTLDDAADHCEDCPELADGSPYSVDDIPTWPAQGDTQCLDRCKCMITADKDSWEKVFGEAA